MTINETTKLTDILNEYPWLIDEAIRFDSKFQILKTPLGKLFIKKATIGALSEKAGLTSEEIIQKLTEMIDSHEA